MAHRWRLSGSRVIGLVLDAHVPRAQAQDAAAFFKGRTVNMEIGYSAGRRL